MLETEEGDENRPCSFQEVKSRGGKKERKKQRRKKITEELVIIRAKDSNVDHIYFPQRTTVLVSHLWN